ncbi:MAG: VOC family protein [Gammaproteobacteria bacterium]|nr:VOC family protein [Gammaproteobacteria bacterium]
MTVSIYLTFDGNCREALSFYCKVFETDFNMISTFNDSPEPFDMPDEEKNQVMHASLNIGNNVLMGSDQGDSSRAFISGNNFHISVDGESREQVDSWFGQLSEGGDVTMPLQETFWGSYFGSCTDRFGINWMVSHEVEQTDS